MKIKDAISRSEEKYLSSVESFFRERWGETKLWSHDLSHHRRVWNNAKELLQTREDATLHFVENLLIACFLHDIGMSVDPGEKHGTRSRMICSSFLEEKNIDIAGFTELLEAVENHDDKDYKGNRSGNRLLLYLSVADDLDAFGCLGALRYADIYMRRGVPVSDLSRYVLENAGSRYRNFEVSFSGNQELLRKHKKRYISLRDFYSSLNGEV